MIGHAAMFDESRCTVYPVGNGVLTEEARSSFLAILCLAAARTTTQHSSG